MHEGRSRQKTAGNHLLRPTRNHLLPMVALSLLLGIFLVPHTQAGGWPWGLLLLALALGVVLRKGEAWAYPPILLFFFALGLLWAQAWLSPAAPAEGTYEIHGRVHGEPTIRTEKRMTFLLGQVTLDGREQAGQAYCTVHVYGDTPLPTLFDGAEISFTGRVYHPQGKSGEHDFDFRMWMYQNQRAYGISSIRDLQIENTVETAPWYDVAARVRMGMRSALTRVMGEEAGLAMAMLISDREGLAQDENEAFQKTGIAHVLSVSGLHVAIVAAQVFWLLKKLRLRRGLQLLVMAACLMGYCMLTGFSAAAVRAAIMAILVALGRMLNRRTDPLLTLSAAMVLVLLVNPLQLFSAGFVLSFSAMAGILLLNPLFLRCMGRDRRAAYQRRAMQKPGRPLITWVREKLGDPLELLSISLSAQLGVLLPTAAYFHQLPLYGLVINLLIVPLTGLLLPLYFIVLALSPVPYLGAAMGLVASWGTRALLELVKLLATLPYAAVRVPTAPAFIACGAALCAVLASWYFRGSRKARWLSMALVAALSVAGAYADRPADLRYIQLSVGQADAALIMDGSATLAVDVGEFGDATAGYLLAEGRNLDAVFLTHLHLDHALGVNDLLDSGIAIGTVYLPLGGAEQQIGVEAQALLNRLMDEGIPIVELAAGDEVRYNKVAMTVLWPWPGGVRPVQDANNWSMVMQIDFDGYGILSTGDLLGSYEAYAAAPADVLKVAHHGSAGGTGGPFLDFVSPRIALVSCAAGDRALPATETLERLGERGISLYRTDEVGEITLTVRDGQLWLTTYKERNSQ